MNRFCLSLLPWFWILLSQLQQPCQARATLTGLPFASSRIFHALRPLPQRRLDRRTRSVGQRSFDRFGRGKHCRGGSQEDHRLGEIDQKENIAPEGGDDYNDGVDQQQQMDQEEERYSRQVYALGHRAHRLIRSSAVYLDGPLNSGLVYEIAKNLVLSGIHRLVLVVRSSETTTTTGITAHCSNYHNPLLDDLGAAYVRAAAQETKHDMPSDDDQSRQSDILLEYIKRLNPSVQVHRRLAGDIYFGSAPSSSSSEEHDDSSDHLHRDTEDDGPIVYMAVDRPQSTSQALNDWLRQQSTRQKATTKTDVPVLAFVSVETAGVYGRIFTDFGSEFVVHDADGEPPALTPLLQVSQDGSNEDGDLSYQVHCMPGEKHDLSRSDELKFHLRNGECLEASWSCTVERVQSPYLVRVRFTYNGEEFKVPESSSSVLEQLQAAKPVAFSRVKHPQTLSFVSLEQALRKQQNADGASSGSLVTPSDLGKSLDAERQETLFCCFSALDRFVQEEGRLPSSSDKEKMINAGNIAIETPKAKSIVSNFVDSCAAKLTPLQGVIGALAAQEALKAVSGLYTPIQQFLFFDCEELLCSDERVGKNSNKAVEVDSNVHDANGLQYILGDEVVQLLQSRKLFIAGAGAIGCELLKSLAALGAATTGGGRIVMTDMDTIEKSNLSRQLLFRDADLGHFKSVAAKRATLLFNPNCNIEAHSSKLGTRHDPKSSNSDGGYVFEDDENFWSQQVDIVLNALDNVDARLYMDNQCVKHHKGMVDAGTMGPKGNVQVVVPNLSESYASSADPPEDAIPVCTLKNFPYAIAHTIQWSRDLFDGLFVRRPQQANDFVTSVHLEEHGGSGEDAHVKAISEMAQKLLHESGEQAALNTAQELAEDLSTARTVTNAQDVRSHALKWSASLAWKLYVESVDELLNQHPLDSKDEDGDDFWTGTRKPPSRLLFDQSEAMSTEQELINQNLVSFVRHGARLRSETFLPTSSRDVLFSVHEAKEALLTYQEKRTTACAHDQDAPTSKSDEVFHHLKAIPAGPEVTLNMADFEKDDDANGHVAFLASASNLRAISYGIPPVDAMETRRVAGQIIPAMITTTAFVSALSCLELIKLVQRAPLRQHRNAFVNLALPFFAFTAPLPAETIPGLNGRQYTLWDQLSISESSKAAANKSGGMTVKSLLKRIQKLANPESADTVQVLSVSMGPYLLYADFLHQEDADLQKSSIWNVIQEAIDSGDDDDKNNMREPPAESGSGGSAEHLSANDEVFDLSVVVEDTTTGEEAELPLIRLRRFQKL